MLKAFDIVLVGLMVVAATITYSIKHKADEKQKEVERLEAEIKLERDTIELLRADWALLTQPNRLHKLVNAYTDQLKLEPTAPTQLARPAELPMLKSQLPQPAVANVEDLIRADGAGSPKPLAATPKAAAPAKTVAAHKTAASAVRPASGPVAIPAQRPDTIKTGSVRP